jgi:hypothetical protein
MRMKAKHLSLKILQWAVNSGAQTITIQSNPGLVNLGRCHPESGIWAGYGRRSKNLADKEEKDTLG